VGQAQGILPHGGNEVITISGEVKRIERIKVVPPDDGVHMRGPDGWMKGCHSCYIGDVLVPRGMVGFYWRIKDGKGVKVYYSLKHDHATCRRIIKAIRRNMIRLAGYGVCKKPGDLCRVQLNLKINGKRIKRMAVGLVVQHINYPEQIWLDYMKGNPYDWNGLDRTEHPDHNPRGFLEFTAYKTKIVKKLGLNINERDRIGNSLYDTIDKRWYFVDVG
jgi:hypothetical protein